MKEVVTTNEFGICRFNTVNGKCCCNVSYHVHHVGLSYDSFNTVNGKCCCNNLIEFTDSSGNIKCFNTVNGKCCCNGKKISRRE